MYSTIEIIINVEILEKSTKLENLSSAFPNIFAIFDKYFSPCISQKWLIVEQWVGHWFKLLIILNDSNLKSSFITNKS